MSTTEPNTPSATQPTDGEDENSAAGDHEDENNTAEDHQEGGNDNNNIGFATLRPLTRTARQLFAQVMRRMCREPAWAPNARRFLVPTPELPDAVDWGQRPVADMHQAELDTLLLLLVTNPDPEADPNPNSDYPLLPQLSGFYRLHLDVAPLSMEAGWVVGSSVDAADLLLTPTAQDAQVASLRAKHCQLAFGAAHSDALFMRAAPAAEVVLDGQLVLTQPRVARADNGLCFGTLHYRLSYTQHLPAATFQRQLEDFRHRRGLPPLERPASSTPTPSKDAAIVQHWSVDSAAFSGSYGSVSIGRHLTTGAAVAAKRLLVKPSTVHLVQKEVKALRCLTHECILHLASDFQVDPALYQPLRNSVLELFLITEPYMTSTLDMAEGLCEQDECKLLSDIFRGLAFMHAQGYLHRDLKPRNIGVTFSPPRAVLLDLGACMEGLSSSDHMVGTITYLAPEVVLLKKQASVRLSLMPPYSASADVWSAALAGAEMVCRYVLSRIWSAAGQWVSDHYIEQAQSYLRDRRQHASPRFRQTFHLLESALAPEPDSRPTAQQLAIDLCAVLHDLQTLDAGDTPEERPSTRLKVGK